MIRACTVKLNIFFCHKYQRECFPSNEISPPVSDHAGWWLQGAESAGCQKAHSEDDGGEGKASFVSHTVWLYTRRQLIFSGQCQFIFDLRCWLICCRVRPWSTWSQKNRLCPVQLMSVWWLSATSGKCYGNRIITNEENHVVAISSVKFVFNRKGRKCFILSGSRV